ncbi:MAG: response regulator [Gemmataceae bacterium]
MTVLSKNDRHFEVVGNSNLRDRFGLAGAIWEPPQNGAIPDCGAARPLCVAIVDDNRDCADTLAMLIRNWGHEPHVAYGGAKAIDMVFAFSPEVILLDIGMPELDGLQVARRVRRIPRSGRTVLIATTGYVDAEHCRLCQDAGFNYFFAKPYDPLLLKELLHSILPRWKRRGKANPVLKEAIVLVTS